MTISRVRRASNSSNRPGFWMTSCRSARNVFDLVVHGTVHVAAVGKPQHPAAKVLNRPPSLMAAGPRRPPEHHDVDARDRPDNPQKMVADPVHRTSRLPGQQLPVQCLSQLVGRGHADVSFPRKEWRNHNLRNAGFFGNLVDGPVTRADSCFKESAIDGVIASMRGVAGGNSSCTSRRIPGWWRLLGGSRGDYESLLQLSLVHSEILID